MERSARSHRHAHPHAERVMASLFERASALFSSLRASSAARTQLHAAVRAGDEGEVERLLAGGAAVDGRDEYGRTPLHIAAEFGRRAVAGRLLDAGAAIEARTDQGDTPFLRALICEQGEFAEWLESRGADIAATRPHEQRDGLIGAANTGRRELARRMVARGVPINALTPEGYTRLTLVNDTGAEILLALGADVTIPDRDGVTPVQNPRISPVQARLYLEHGADATRATATGTTALHEAADADALEVAELLVARGAAVDAVNGSGQTPLHTAVLGRHPRMIAFLLSHGAAVDGTDRDGWTSLHHAATAFDIESSEPYPELVRLLLARGANVNAVTPQRSTPLHLVAESLWGSPVVARLLLDAGANVAARDDEKNTPAERARTPGVRALLGSAP